MILVLRCVAYFVGDSVDRTWCWCVWPVWHGFRTLKGQSSLAKYSLSLGQEIQESKVSHPEVSHGFSFDSVSVCRIRRAMSLYGLLGWPWERERGPP